MHFKTAFLLSLPACAFLAQSVEASALLKPTSGVTQALSPKSLSIESQLRGAFAQTVVTTVYANPNESQIEADFMYSAPSGSVVTGFSYWYGKEKVVARVVERGRAAKIYQYITSRMRDPALIEMVGPNKFRARIFPVEAGADLKIEVRLAQTLGASKNGQSWTWPLREETSGGALQNVSLHLRSDRAFSSNLGATKNNELRFERKNFKAIGDARALVPQNAAPLRASLVAAREGGPDGFFALALTNNSPVASPRFKISGVSTYDVLVPTKRRLGASENFVVVGRYRGSGTALVSLNGRSVQVNFPNAREKNILSSLLWASSRMESLSGRDKNKTQVMALSKRFGIPSKWTSWLAIPEEERRNFKRQMWTSDRADAAKAYAQAVSRGDGATMKAQRAVFEDLTKKLKADDATEEELQPLSAYLNDELRRLQSAQLQVKYDRKIPKNKNSQWARWAKNLRRAGATDGGQGVDLPVYVVEDELRIASRLYLREVEAGRTNSAQAKKMQARLKELAATKTAKQYEWDETTFLGEQAGERATELVQEVQKIRAAKKPDRAREKNALLHLARLGRADIDDEGTIQQALESVWGDKIKGPATTWAQEIRAGRLGSDKARRAAKEVRALQAQSGYTHIEDLDAARSEIAARVAAKYQKDVQTQGVRGQAARDLEAQLAVMAPQLGTTRGELQSEVWGLVAEPIAQQLLSEVQSENAKPEKVRVLQDQLRAIQDQKQADIGENAASAWSRLAWRTGNQLATEIKSGRENGVRAKALQAQLREQQRRADSDDSYANEPVQRAWQERTRVVAQRYIEATSRGKTSASQMRHLRAQGEHFARNGGTDFSSQVTELAQENVSSLQSQVSAEIAQKRENGSQIKELRARIAATQKMFPGATSGGNEERFAWEGRAHEAAYRLLEAEQKMPADVAQLKALKDELDQSVKQGGKNKTEVLEWEKGRIARNEPLVNATDYRLRSGDPLISVLAPSTCQSVVAQMPDGSLLPLRFNPLNHAWEARFDVPTFAPDGDYRVQIFLVANDGSRRHLTMNFAVDSSAPKGNGAVRSNGKTWHLQLQSDEQTDRVSAFLPWNERVELKRDENANFVADVAVPAAFQNTQTLVRFVLTDGAHNKTEVRVDLNR